MIKIILMILVSYLGQKFLPWWIVPICIAIISLFFKASKFMAFISGFVAIALLWVLFALHLDIHNISLLSKNISHVLHLPSPLYLFVVTGFIGGILGGLGGLLGLLLRLFIKKN